MPFWHSRSHPQQDRPWHPDPAIPTNVRSAVETLFEQEFPNPRGCEYREIKGEVSGVWAGKALLLETHGRVLPEKSGTNRVAICWNGLIYPAAKFSAPAEFHAEVASSNWPPPWRFGFSGGSAIGEAG